MTTGNQLPSNAPTGKSQRHVHSPTHTELFDPPDGSPTTLGVLADELPELEDWLELDLLEDDGELELSLLLELLEDDDEELDDEDDEELEELLDEELELLLELDDELLLELLEDEELEELEELSSQQHGIHLTGDSTDTLFHLRDRCR